MSTSEYIQLRDSLLMKLLMTKDVQLLQKIEELFNNNEEDFFDELPKEVQNSLLKSIDQANRGELIPHEEVMKKYGR